MESVDIKEFLKEQCGGDVCYLYPNPGNGGDNLIAAATYQVFDSLGINYRTINTRKEFDPKGKIILYSGGGNLVKRGKHAQRVISKYHKDAKKFILLPHTVDSHEDLLLELGKNVLLVAREKRTYEYLKKSAPGAQHFLSHDMAMLLDVNDALNYKSPGHLESTIRSILDYFISKDFSKSPAKPHKRLASIFIQLKLKTRLQNRKELNAFRQDPEMRDFQKPKDNIDISAVFTYGTHSKESVFTGAHEFLCFLNKFEVINTDRLHACIGAALLGKQVNFYANDYYKCEEVYNMSLKQFDNIAWKGNEEP
jgi:exopolysaccharide biosynthesis predicted pyruvyltransferase EpsI